MSVWFKQGTGLAGVMPADYSHSSQVQIVSRLRDVNVHVDKLILVPVAHDLEWRSAFSSSSSIIQPAICLIITFTFVRLYI